MSDYDYSEFEDAEPGFIIEKKVPDPIKFDTPIRNEIRHNSDAISDGFKMILVTGRTMSGKTYSLHYLLPCLMDPDFIIICTKSPGQPTYKNIEKHYLAKKIPVLEISDRFPQLIEEYKKFRHIICVFDDLSTDDMEKHVEPFFRKGRHFNMTTILINQNFFDIPTTIRKNANMLLMFRTSDNMMSMYKAHSWIFGEGGYALFKKILDFIFSKKYNYLTIDHNCPPSIAVREGLNKIIKL